MWGGSFGSYCKSCDKRKGTMNKRKNSKDTLKSRGRKVWEKVNKNHYPDPEWVWTQIENNESPASYTEKLNAKYSLSTHGNTGRTNRWKNKNK